ncbi:hypothetical protein AV926_04810 [Myroides marinus]|uniref:Uncharacterized protein n=1 Tax=Myroides marinus TaxID=703342 RepID=A0A165RK30_9FLAO|nr:hypothetical protein [Myroides marinus]KZE82872.1 hypothetical protein AV926_04810 [Myroides marinus]
MTVQEKLLLNALDVEDKYFLKYKRKVLSKLESFHLEAYAKERFDLIEKNEASDYCECDIKICLSSYEDSDIEEEFNKRELYLPYSDIVRNDLYKRFIELLHTIPLHQLESVIKDLETKA